MRLLSLVITVIYSIITYRSISKLILVTTSRCSIRLYLLFEIQSLTLFRQWVTASYYLVQSRCADHFTFTLRKMMLMAYNFRSQDAKTPKQLRLPRYWRPEQQEQKCPVALCTWNCWGGQLHQLSKSPLHWIWFGLWWVEEQRGCVHYSNRKWRCALLRVHLTFRV